MNINITVRYLILMGGVSLLVGCGAYRTAPVEDRAVGATGGEIIHTSKGAAKSYAIEDETRSVLKPLGAGRSGSGANAMTPLPNETAAETANHEPSTTLALAKPSRPAASGASDNAGVVALLNQANTHTTSGDHTRAAASIERAIRIEPRNPWLWYRLAQERYAEERLDDAASLAAKSKSMATTNPRLQADSLRLIAEVRDRQGDPQAARIARDQARNIVGQ